MEKYLDWTGRGRKTKKKKTKRWSSAEAILYVNIIFKRESLCWFIGNLMVVLMGYGAAFVVVGFHSVFRCSLYYSKEECAVVIAFLKFGTTSRIRQLPALNPHPRPPTFPPAAYQFLRHCLVPFNGIFIKNVCISQSFLLSSLILCLPSTRFPVPFPLPRPQSEYHNLMHAHVMTGNTFFVCVRA